MEKPSAREGMNVADGCSLFTNEDRQMVFPDLTFLTAPLLSCPWPVQGAKGQDGFVHITPFILPALGGGEGWAGLQLVQLFWEGVNMVPG